MKSSSASTHQLIHLRGEGQVLICIGTGGVGKTTVAAAIGARAAREGLKTLVLTIDPSKRLATTLGIEGKTEITAVAGEEFQGRLFAAVVDHKSTFDNFIRRAAQKSPEKAEMIEKILTNKLYQQLTTTLSGSQEFTSLERLYSAHISKNFDLIILDTPPAQHAVDFLKAPQQISNLFNDRIAKWFRDSKVGRQGLISTLLSSGTRQVLKALQFLTGSGFISELSDFFVRIESFQDQLQTRVKAMEELLRSKNTEFCLVTAFDQAKLSEAQRLALDLQQQDFQLKYAVVNRAYPLQLADEIRERSIRIPKNYSPELKKLSQRWVDYILKQQDLLKIFQSKISENVTCVHLPEFSTDISNTQDLKFVMEQLPVEIKAKSVH